MPCICCIYTIHILTILFVRDMTRPQVLILCSWSSSISACASSTIPHKYTGRQRDAFECGCADGAGPTTRRGSHVYEINTWLWNLDGPSLAWAASQWPRLRRSKGSPGQRLPSADGQLSGLASDLRLVYVWYIHGIYLVYPWYILSDSKSCLFSAIK